MIHGVELLFDGLNEHAQDRAIHVVEEVHPHQNREHLNPLASRKLARRM